MSAAVLVAFKNDGFVQALQGLGRSGDNAIRRALGRTTTSSRAFMASAISRDTGARVGKVKEEIKARVDPDGLVATVSISGKRLPLIEFRATGPDPSRGRGRGVLATVEGQRKRYPNAFIATMRSGHRGVFTRVGQGLRKSAGARSRNLPIAELFGPSLARVFSKFLPLGAQQAETALAKNLEHEFQFVMSKER
jgi:hypothetical protein